jgi:heat shock protein HtpX
MISALKKISGRSLVDAPDSVRELMLDNPRAGPSALFTTHPSIEKRIEALVKYAGGAAT